MARSKLVQANEKIAEKVTEGYKKIEDGVVSGYKMIENGVIDGFTKMTDKFVDSFLTRDGKSIEDAKKRVKAETDARTKIFLTNPKQNSNKTQTIMYYTLIIN